MAVRGLRRGLLSGRSERGEQGGGRGWLMAVDCEAETNGRPLVMALPKGLLICGVRKVTVERGQRDRQTDWESKDGRTDR